MEFWSPPPLFSIIRKHRKQLFLSNFLYRKTFTFNIVPCCIVGKKTSSSASFYFYTSPILFFLGLACRILQVGPRGSKFLGPVLIEVPHVASLRDGDREVVVLRCDSASKGNWTEHVQEQLDDKTLKVLKYKTKLFKI